MRLPVKNTLPRIIGALLLALLAGCSAVKTGYNNAPSLLYWWLDGYFDFNDAQATPVRRSLEELQAWHRRDELPVYASQLREIQQLAAAPVTPAQVCPQLERVRGYLTRAGLQGAEGLARLAPTMQPEQLRYLTRQFDKHNQSWREEWLDGSPDELLERRLNRTADRYSDFYGRLSEGQMALLRQRLAESGFDPRLAWRERLRRQQDLLATLQEHRGADRPAHVKAEMLALVQRSLEPPDPAVRRQLEQVLQHGCQTLVLLHNSASAEQRRRLAGKLRGYETDLHALIAVR
jgi:hypothetical protein